MKVHTYCRLCEGSCGLIADLDDNGVLGLEGDPDDPVSAGFCCDTARASLRDLSAPERFTQPMKRGPDGLQPVSWEQAIQEIGAAMRELRAGSGRGSLGLYLGDEPWRSSRSLVRSLAFGVTLGTPHVFSELCMGVGPRLKATELMLGQPTPLLTDLDRTHYAIILGGDPGESDWGPWQRGQAHEAWLQHSRRTKVTKVIVADPRRTPLAESVDGHLALRPGTEVFFLLGMLVAVVQGGWQDQQFVRDHTRGWDQLQRALQGWSVDRCAQACGLEAADISGVALKFSRAAMAVVHPGAAAFQGTHASVAAWGWLALHAVTANLLRPGGLYDHEALFDTWLPIASVPSRSAPRTRVADHPLTLLQAAATLLPDEVLTPGQGQLRGLVVVNGDPASRLPGSERVEQALRALDLLVVLGRQPDATTALADWVLPVTHPWEQAELTVHDAALLPVQAVAWTPALAAPADQVRPVEQILRDLHRAIHPGLRGSPWGLHLALAARYMAQTDLDTWEKRLVGWMLPDGAGAALASPPHRFAAGDSDRGAWRVDGERIELAPETLVAQLSSLEPVRPDPERPLWLRTSRRPRGDQDLGLVLHPDHGIAEGTRVRLETRYGAVETTVHLDAGLRADVADLPGGASTPTAVLLSGAPLDPLSGAPEVDGLPCSVSLIS